MAMSVVYTTVNGQILSESRGGTVSHFVPDPLGSVVMVRDTSGNTVYEAEYDPYGNVQSETGTNPSSLGYVGTLGYIKDSVASMYVRARYLLNNLGRWLTKDPLWPEEPGYVYTGAAPTLMSDPSGLDPTLDYWGNYCGSQIGISPVGVPGINDLVYGNPDLNGKCVATTQMENWPTPTGCLDYACLAHDLCLAPYKDIMAPEAAHCHCNAANAALQCMAVMLGASHPKVRIFFAVFAALCAIGKSGSPGKGKPIREDIDPCKACHRQAREACRRQYPRNWRDYGQCVSDYNHRYCRHIAGCRGEG